MSSVTGEEPDRRHEPVMLGEVMQYLACRSGGRYLDLTVGGGGHARAILELTGPTGLLIGVDRDEEVLRDTTSRLKKSFTNARFIHGNFAEIDELSRHLGSIGFDGLLLDLGASSLQLDDSERGFSFGRSGPLDMRMDRSGGKTAAELLREISEGELGRLIRELGEDRNARRIARAIVRERQRAPLRDTAQLAGLIERVSPSRGHRIHPATRTFQALRIAVNDELGNLERFLARFRRLLEPHGVIVVISFHSLEDRLVKRSFREGERDGWLEILTRKPVRATARELERNRRARSARLRAARLLG
jgi:16S rRNA (cytosine1402-N4)-methyltransferase